MFWPPLTFIPGSSGSRGGWGSIGLVPDQLDFAILRSRSAAALTVHPRTPRAAASLGPRLARNLARHSAGSREVWGILVGGALVQLGELLPRSAEMSLHCLVVLGIGEFGQITLPVPEPAPDLAQIAPGHAAVAPLGGRLRVQHEQAVDGPYHAVPFLALPEGALEIAEHARQELPARHRRIVLGQERHRASHYAPHELLAFLGSHEGASVEGVEENLRIIEPRPRDEVARQPYALDGEAETLAHLHEHQAQRDGNALAPVQHVVQEAVARIVELVAIAGETLLHEEVFAKAVQAPEGVGGAAGAVHGAGQTVQTLQVGVGVEPRILPAGDGQGGPPQIEAAVTPRDQLGELEERRVAIHQQPGA